MIGIWILALVIGSNPHIPLITIILYTFFRNWLFFGKYSSKKDYKAKILYGHVFFLTKEFKSFLFRNRYPPPKLCEITIFLSIRLNLFVKLHYMILRVIQSFNSVHCLGQIKQITYFYWSRSSKFLTPGFVLCFLKPSVFALSQHLKYV